MITLQSPAEVSTSFCPDAWAIELARRTSLSATESAQAAGAVLEALVENLPKEDILAFVAGLGPAMRPRLEDALAARSEGQTVRVDSLVASVSARLPRRFPHHACLVTRIVLEIVAAHCAPEVVSRILAATPGRWRKLWPQATWRANAFT